MKLGGTTLERKDELRLPKYEEFIDKGIFWFTGKTGITYCVELSFGKIYIMKNNATSGVVIKTIGEMSPENYEKALEEVAKLYC